ncbi:restriction endonuclease fold toxin-2 domain-containing protein [Streptomyces adelaidensis]|uniref:restriction endonuclease fold toxin-2 domain-containing protein n=1 Tax=Streptomyces adelaidensis TaxID=2796465 RepID=UPI001F39FBA7|nr:restriction endonuclease fold toxin-2 domain-containing protein [Streptomyces adelaidensis]
MDLRHQTANFVNASWSLVDLRDLIFETVSLLSIELAEQAGMAGDDEAGRAFATVYKAAVSTVYESAGHAHQAMASGAGALLKSAEAFLKQESEIAAELLGQGMAPGIGSQPSGPDCNQRASHHAEDLPEVVGETSWTDQYLLSQRFRGQQTKLRNVAKSWRAAAGIMSDAYWDSDTAWQTATLDQAGETANAVQDWFKVFIGKKIPPDEVGDDDTLIANLYAACKMLANACDAYADHIETALKRIPEESDPLFGEPLWGWEEPFFGGNGHDGGLHELVAGDTRIASLGSIPPALDQSKARVKIPQPDEGGGLFPSLPPIFPPLIRTPLIVPVAYRPANGPRVQPVPPPAPPDPRFPLLTGSEQNNFQTWLNSLREGDVSGGKPAEVAYQKRVAGYPEYEVPIPQGLSKNSTLMVDGFRDADGMAIEAKYVNDEKKCYRTLDELRTSHNTGKKDFLYGPDRNELQKYAAALNDPRNTEMRGVETVTNNQDSVAYWRVMMAAYGVKGYARYEP